MNTNSEAVAATINNQQSQNKSHTAINTNLSINLVAAAPDSLTSTAIAYEIKKAKKVK
jgi:hypothetical protein